MNDTIAARMAADRETMQQHEHGGLDDLHTALDATPIHEAARENDLFSLREIVAQESTNTIHTVDKYGLTALHWAADRGNTECAQYLISMGARVDQVEQRLFRRVPLHFAAIAPSLDIVKLLLAHGADPREVEYCGWTAYHFAAYAGAVDVMRALEAHGVDPQSRTKVGETALHLAAKNGKVDVVRHVLESSNAAEDLLRLGDANGKTALQLAQEASHTEVVRLMTQATEEPEGMSVKDPHGRARRGSGLDSISTEASSAPAS